MRRPLIQINVTCGCNTAAILERLDAMANDQQATADALAANLNTVADQLGAGLTGLGTDIADLKAQIAAAGTPVDFTAVDASLARVQAAADALTQLDAETPAPAEPTA
jgi:hypothetical protein